MVFLPQSGFVQQAIPLRRSRLNSDCLPFLELAALRQLIGHCG
jgi:hypothetical protein